MISETGFNYYHRLNPTLSIFINQNLLCISPLDSPGSLEDIRAEISHERSGATSRATVSQVSVEEAALVVRRSNYRTEEARRPTSYMETLHVNRFHRLSVPDLQSRHQAGRPRRERVREEFQERAVGPPKQTRYFCRNCKADICNACFSTVCSAHNVQFLGAAYFHCKSPFHKIQHVSKPNDRT